jgi:DNA-binding GntR family transcriptional regulator
MGAEPQLKLSDKAYRIMRQKIMTGEFSPYTRLAEAALGQKIGMSRTPVREALVQLTNDGLIRKVNGGYYVSQPDFTDIAELYEMRILLEKHGIERGINQSAYDMDALDDLKALWESKLHEVIEPDPDFVLNDEAYHVALLRASGNQIMGDYLQAINLRIRSVRMYDFITKDRIDWTIETHLSILESAAAGNLDEAQTKLEQHILKSMQVVESRASSTLRQMVNTLSEEISA